MNYRIALLDSKTGQIVGRMEADGSLHAHSEETRVLDADTMDVTGTRLVGRKGETVRVPAAIEDCHCKPEAWAGVKLVLVGEDNKPHAVLGFARSLESDGK